MSAAPIPHPWPPEPVDDDELTFAGDWTEAIG
jgi:hypothetical protein